MRTNRMRRIGVTPRRTIRPAFLDPTKRSRRNEVYRLSREENFFNPANSDGGCRSDMRAPVIGNASSGRFLRRTSTKLARRESEASAEQPTERPKAVEADVEADGGDGAVGDG